jgi:hypothetical protein
MPRELGWRGPPTLVVVPSTLKPGMGLNTGPSPIQNTNSTNLHLVFFFWVCFVEVYALFILSPFFFHQEIESEYALGEKK